jgi:hypothetical protein
VGLLKSISDAENSPAKQAESSVESDIDEE